MPSVARGLYRWLFRSGARLEDFADRLNHVWTFGLLLILGVVISWKHGYQDPITCWCPAEFMKFHVAYAHKTCWHSYYILFPDEENEDVLGIPPPRSYLPMVQQKPNEDVTDYNTTYYQWVPVVLCLQALLFKLPNIILYIFHSYSGVDFDKIAGLTDGYQNLGLNERYYVANQISRYIHRWCNMFPRGLPWRLLTAVWFLVKAMYCINIVTQLVYVDKFLNPEFNSTSYGKVIYDNLAKNATFWRVSPVFPRTVLCEFSIRQRHNIHIYTVQCDLTANIFTEYAYMFLWVWFLFVAIVTMMSFLCWTLLTLLPFCRNRYIKKFMELADASHEGRIARPTDQDVSMVTSILGEDGVMVLKLVAANSSELLVRDVVCGISRITRGGTGGMSGHMIQQPAPGTSQTEPTAPPGIYPTVAVINP